jgi:hypothetical protein
MALDDPAMEPIIMWSNGTASIDLPNGHATAGFLHPPGRRSMFGPVAADRRQASFRAPCSSVEWSRSQRRQAL